MTRTILLLATLMPAAAPLTAQAPVRAQETDCRAWSDRDSELYCEEREYVVPSHPGIEIDAGQNGGIAVTGWDRDEVRVVATIQAQAEDGARARQIAEAVEVRVAELIRAEGPRVLGRDEEYWSASFEVYVPRETRLRMEAQNGGIRLEGLTGQVDARTTNGGLSVRDSGGRIRGQTTNGGLHIELSGSTWRGEGLDLRSTNGGVTIHVPDGYSAELETGTVNGGLELEFPVTLQGRIDRRLRTTLGNGGPLIRATTTNGGVSLRRI